MEFGKDTVCPMCGGTVRIAIVMSMMAFLAPTLHKFWIFGCVDCGYRLIHSAEDGILPNDWFESYTEYSDIDEAMAKELRRLID